jgi:hypothetical protein
MRVIAATMVAAMRFAARRASTPIRLKPLR